MSNIKPPWEYLPLWMKKVKEGEIYKIGKVIELLINDLSGWYQEAAIQLNIDTCHDEIVDLYAWESHLYQVRGESKDLFRLRVKNAFLTAQESGYKHGLEKILTEHGVSNFTVQERVPGEDWDKIYIEFDNEELLNVPSEVLDQILQEWGRTCRRYITSFIEKTSNDILMGSVELIRHFDVYIE